MPSAATEMGSSNDPIWHIGLYDRHVFRNGRLGVLCLKCEAMFWEAVDADQKISIEKGLKKHLLTAHEEYGLKLLKLMLDEDDEELQKKEEEVTEGIRQQQFQRDTNTSVSSVGTAHSHFVEAIHTMPTEPIEEKSQLVSANCLRNPAAAECVNKINECDKLAKSLPLAQTDGDGTSTSTECDAVTVSTTTPPISAELLAAAQQLCASLLSIEDDAVGNEEMPKFTPNMPKVSRIVDENCLEEPTDQFSIDLPELPGLVFPIYVDEHSMCWHWLHAAKNESQAASTYEKRLISKETDNQQRLFYGCATDKHCPFRAVWVRERLAVYKSEEHNHCPLLSPQRSTNGTDLLITDQSINATPQLPSADVVIRIGSPIVINVSAGIPSVAVDLNKTNGPISGGSCSSQKAALAEQWKLLAYIEADESNLASVCSQWGLARKNVRNYKDGTTGFQYGCVRRTLPFCCKFRTMFIRGQNSMYYKAKHNHSIPLSGDETNWLKEWRASQRQKKAKKRQKKLPMTPLNPPSSSLNSSWPFVVSDQQTFFSDQQQISSIDQDLAAMYALSQQDQWGQQSLSQNALQDFITSLTNRPSTSKQSDVFQHYNSLLNECAEMQREQQSNDTDERSDRQQNLIKNGEIKQESFDE